jgi:hypothetical protein
MGDIDRPVVYMKGLRDGATGLHARERNNALYAIGAEVLFHFRSPLH